MARPIPLSIPRRHGMFIPFQATPRVASFFRRRMPESLRGFGSYTMG